MNRFSITSKGIGDALQRSASALSASGNTLDESIGLITAANEVVQDPTSVGTALKTLSLRLRGAKTELEEAGLEAEGMATTTATLQKKLLGLTGGKVDIMLDPDTFKSSTQILREMAGAWEDMTDIQRSAALELMGGKRQANILSSIIQNFDTVENVIETSANSSNSALAENARWMDSIEGKSKQFTNAVSAMWNDAIGRDTIKTFVDIGTVLIKLADGVDVFGYKIGSLWTTVALVSTLLIKTFTKRTWGEFFLDIGTSIHSVNTKLEGFAARFGLVNAATQSAGAASKGLTVGLFQEKLAMAGVSEESQRALLAKMGLATVNKDTLITSKNLTGSILHEAIANKTLTTTQAVSMMQKAGLITATKGLSGATTGLIAKTIGLDNAQAISLAKTLGLVGTTKQLTKEEIKAAVAKLALKDATKAQQLENLLLLASQGKLIASFKLLGMQINDFLSKNKLLLSIAAAAAAIYGVTKAFDASITTLKESEESLTDLNSTLESTQSKLNDLESQLSDTKSRMEELNSLESLSFVEQEELDKLRSQTQELERQIALTKQIKAGQQKSVNNQALETVQQYKDANFKSGKGKEDYAQTGATVGNWVGGTAGGIAAGTGVAAASTALVASGSKIGAALGTFLGGPIGTAIGVALGAAAGAAILGLVGSSVGGAVAEGSNQVGEAMDDMLTQRKKLEEDYNKAKEAYAKNPEKKSIAEDYEEAEKALSDYDSMMSEHISKLDSYYSQIDLNVYDPVLDKQKIEDMRKEMNDFYDTQDKWAIANGGQDAKANALNRIFGENASEELKRVKKAIKETLETADDINLEEIFNESNVNWDAFIDRLRQMGIYAYEAEQYFEDMAEAEKEAAGVDFSGVVSEIRSVSDGVKSLKSAWDEVNEHGFVTYETLDGLKEKFGELGEEWKYYFNIMASGAASHEAMIYATERLAQAFIDNKIINGNITPQERQAYIIQLEAMGFENVEEYIDDKLEENMYREIRLSAKFDEKDIENNFNKLKESGKLDDIGVRVNITFDELTTEEYNKITEYSDDVIQALSKSISFEDAKKITDEYGYEFEESELKAVIDLLDQRNQKEQELIQTKKDLDEYNAFVYGDGGYKQMEEDIERANQATKAFSEEVKNFNELDYSFREGVRWNNKTDTAISDADFNKLKEEHSEYLEFLRRTNSEIADAQKKFDELRQKGIDNNWLNEDGTLKEGVEAEFEAAYKAAEDGVEELENKIKAEFTDPIELNLDITGIGKTGSIFDQYVSEMETLASIQAAVANGFTISAQKAREFAAVYPEILANAKAATGGQITLNSGVVNAFLSGKKAELDADIQTEIEKLEAHRASLVAYRDFIAAQIEGVKSGAIAEADAVYAVEKYKVDLYNDSVEQFAEGGEANTDTSEATTGNMMSDSQQYNTQVAATAEDTATNMYNAASNMSENTAKAYDSMIKNANAYGQAAAAAAKASTTGEFSPSSGTSNTFSGSAPTESTTNNVDYTPLGNDPTTLKKKKDPKKFDESALDTLNKYLDEANKAIASVDGTIALLKAGPNSKIKDWNPDKDKGGSKDKEDAAEKARKELEAKYEGELTNVENQKKHLENQIARLEAEDKGVSRSYYDEQIDLANKELDILEKKKADLEALFAVDPSQETADALWEVRHRIQEVGTEAIEASKKIVDLYKTAFEGIGSARDDKNTLFGDRQSYIEGYMELMGLQGHLAPASGYRELMAIEEDEKANNIAKLREQDAQYQSYLNSPEYKAGTETALKAAADMEAEMRATEKAIQDNDIALAQFNEDLENLYVEGWDKVMEAFDNKDFIYSAREDIANSFIDRLEILNIDVPESAYKNLIDIRKTRQDNLQEELNFAREELVDIEAQFGTNSEAWISKYQEIVDKEKEKYENETQILEWEQTILNKKYEEFNQLIDRLNYTINNMKNIADLVSDKDMANEDGSWTEEGILSLGMNYQQMEHYKGNIEKTAKQIDELEKEKDKWSDNEYNEKWQELNDILWDNIEGYEGAKDAIVDVHEARIDMIESGIEKEISAMEELIDLKKKELDAERDLYDFRKDTQKQAKDIAALERKLASMGGSTDAATIAERAKLEAQLREAKEGLNDTYYNHAMDSQSNALDDELDAYEKSAESYIEKLQESIKDTDALVEKTLTDLMSNADIVLQEITRISELYGVKIDAGITNPWKNAASEASAFKEGASGYLSSMISEEGIITTFGTNAGKSLSGAFGAGSGAVDQFNQDVTKYMGLVESTVNSYTTPGNEKYLGTKIAAPWDYVKQPNSDGPIYAYSTYAEERMDYVTTAAQNDFEAMKDALNHPWLEAQNTVHTFVSDTEYLLDQLVNKAVEKGKAIGDALKIETPNIVGTPSSDDGSKKNNSGGTASGGGGVVGGAGGGGAGSDSRVRALQEIINEMYGGTLKEDGIWGPNTQGAVMVMQDSIDYNNMAIPVHNGLYNSKTRQALINDLSNMHSDKAKRLKSKVPAAIHAKGTLGTTRDEFAITDESWIGEEITLAAGKNGQLQYLKKGSAVMPADISANLVEWGKLNPNMMGIGDMSGGIQLMSNYVNKPEIKIDVENFLKVDRVDQDSLPQLEKLMDKKIDTFAKQLNASIRKFK